MYIYIICNKSNYIIFYNLAAGDLRHASVKHSNLRQNSQITEQKLTQLEELIKTYNYNNNNGDTLPCIMVEVLFNMVHIDLSN